MLHREDDMVTARWLCLALMPVMSACVLNEAHYKDVLRMPGEIKALQAKTEVLERQVAALQAATDEMRARLDEEINQRHARVERPSAQKLRITLQDGLLFASGSAAVSQAGRKLLGKVAAALKQLPRDACVRIIGYSDDLPVSSKLRSRYADNWELSAARAAAVARVLVWGFAMDGQRIFVEGRGSSDSVADNSTPEGRAKNRRVVILVEGAQGLAGGGAEEEI